MKGQTCQRRGQMVPSNHAAKSKCLSSVQPLGLQEHRSGKGPLLVSRVLGFKVRS